MLSEEFVRTDLLWVENIDQRISVLTQRCGKNYNFVMFMHSLQKVGYSRSHQYKYFADASFDFHGQNNIWVFYRFERWVHQCLVKIENQSFLSKISSSLRPQKSWSLSWFFCLLIINSCFSLSLTLWKCGLKRFRGSWRALHFLSLMGVLISLNSKLLGVCVLRYLANELIEFWLAVFSLFLNLSLNWTRTSLWRRNIITVNSL